MICGCARRLSIWIWWQWARSRRRRRLSAWLSRQKAGPRSQRVWALWELGLLGNRGVVPERVNEILVSQLQDSDPEVRHWAVEGLAYLGTNETIAPLLQEFHDDPSPMVRERAACSLAQSGMLTQEQRHSVIPHLLDYADDASLDAQTHGWVYQALRDITGKNLPNDSSRLEKLVQLYRRLEGTRLGSVTGG